MNCERGVTLAEMLITVAFVATLSAVAIPSFNTADADRLEVAAAEVRNALRFARSEAMRRGKNVLFDAESSPGQVKILVTSCTSLGAPSEVTDPRTKLAFGTNVSNGPFSAGVALTPNFLAGGTAYGGVVFNSAGVPADVCQVTGMNSKGTLQAGSGVLLTLGSRQTTVALDATSGRVTGP